ncbi:MULTISPECIES: L-fucose:H+ symporter permease [Peribacillus]|uniref:L-fucose:H+ symporter permease n=1 Tax=Peribacillus TaxID=2675229 RepID=UPI001F4D5A51|nr:MULTISPECIES: L-fucose:H+ symporter permease [unclassified Peribacillus]MCK1983606.1 L-fucose:H+ symporter permease [Peribacillus sp. Aquil_B1]MCK2010833.1 L-fucose:H+ symporter permease [Peribacillus sp. Aquil_B8]
MKKQNIIQLPDGYLNRTPFFQFILLSLLFPLWAVAASLNDILIAQFKHVFELTDFASALVQSAFYGGYFLIAIPASMVIKKTNYKFAIITGLLFYIVGCSLFYPASHMATYTMFLFAIFSIAIGLGFLETAANTYSSMIGPRKFAILRLNISQTFYPIGAISGILLGKYLVFQKGASLEAQLATMSPAEAQAFGLEMLENTLEPYRYMIFVLIGVLILFIFTKFPSCKPEVKSGKVTEKTPGIIETLKYLGGNKRFRKGIAAQFLYVGMQVTVWSFTIRLALDLNPDINERTASTFMVYSFSAFFVGKFIANFLMTRFSPSKVLICYSIIGSALLAYVVFVPNITAVYAAVAVSMLFGPCWATIYAETLEVIKDKKYTETAGAILVMAIVGGAVIPAVQGFVSDYFGSMQLAFLVSMACFIYVGCYFFGEMKKQNASVQPSEKPVESV